MNSETTRLKFGLRFIRSFRGICWRRRAGEWELAGVDRGGSKIYPILAPYQQEGYQALGIGCRLNQSKSVMPTYSFTVVNRKS